MPARILLHIGTHKTGTTSVQQFLHGNPQLLATVGAACPPGLLHPRLHAELPLLAARPGWLWPARLRFPETQGAGWLAAAEAHIRRQVGENPEATLVLSHEDLSYLRADAELERLRDLLVGPSVEVVVVLRERSAFLRSYAEQLVAAGFELSDDPASFAYVAADSWLADYDSLLAGYRRWFGSDHVVTVDYDATVARDGSVIPALTDRIGLDRAALPPLEPYFLNRAGTHLVPSAEQLSAMRRRVAQQAL